MSAGSSLLLWCAAGDATIPFKEREGVVDSVVLLLDCQLMAERWLSEIAS